MDDKKLIFLDIDGTLTLPGENVPPASALAAIRKAQEKGNLVFLCTGRNYAMLRPLLTYGFDGMVAGAGGYVTYRDEVLFDCPMTDSQTAKALEVLHKNGVFCTLETKNATYGDENLGDFLKDAPAGNSEIERWRKALSEALDIRPMGEYDGAPAYKVVFMCLKEEQLAEPRALLEEEFDFVLQEVPEHGCLNGELINRKYDKGRGVLRICERLGISPEQTYGFGDSMNDAAMIKTVGTGICMANGSAALKEMSDYVCPAVDEDGLAEAFRHFGLC